jgi:hypothetical protein
MENVHFCMGKGVVLVKMLLLEKMTVDAGARRMTVK